MKDYFFNKCSFLNFKFIMHVIKINVSWSADKHIRMISEGDAENSALHRSNKLNWKMYYMNIFISQYYRF